MNYQDTINRIRELTRLDGKSETQRALKLAEEVGEVSAAVLSETNAPGCEYKTLDHSDVLEECVDVLIVAFSMLDQYHFSDEEIQETFEAKLDKWEKVCS
jgi:NTP pyrophosphatase (non-canonical NTP hydrolase)